MEERPLVQVYARIKPFKPRTRYGNDDESRIRVKREQMRLASASYRYCSPSYMMHARKISHRIRKKDPEFAKRGTLLRLSRHDRTKQCSEKVERGSQLLQTQAIMDADPTTLCCDQLLERQREQERRYCLSLKYAAFFIFDSF